MPEIIHQHSTVTRCHSVKCLWVYIIILICIYYISHFLTLASLSLGLSYSVYLSSSSSFICSFPLSLPLLHTYTQTHTNMYVLYSICMSCCSHIITANKFNNKHFVRFIHIECILLQPIL